MSRFPKRLPVSLIPDQGSGMNAAANSGDIQDTFLVFKVSELTQRIKSTLEEQFSFVWVEGELSNVTLHSSGHCYFTLKDDASQIRAVMFRSSLRCLPCKPENGVTVVVRGRLSVYEPRGEYQIIAEAMEPLGKGSLQLAFEQTKKKLAAEGLFDQARKRPLPVLPQKICIITSPTGAALKDILKIIDGRFANISIEVLPVRVQGGEAPREIIAALETVNTLPDIDVVIVGRGGGSMEDLWAFNDEGVARAISACRVPVISAVGHEIDFTIGDFAADLRAPTPSAAAEIVVEKKEAFIALISTLTHRLRQGLSMGLHRCRSSLDLTRRGVVNPRKRLEDLQLRSDDLGQRLQRFVLQNLLRRKDSRRYTIERLLSLSPMEKIQRLRSELLNHCHTISLSMQWGLERCSITLDKAMALLDDASPLMILKRGYSITRTWPEKTVVRDTSSLYPDQILEIKLYKGFFRCRVEETSGNEEKVNEPGDPPPTTSLSEAHDHRKTF